MQALPREVIQAQVAKILSSKTFRRKPRLSAFLQFTVEETVNGGHSRLKEYSIAVAVFNRPESFDPRLDSIVRVEARRLRATMEEYYTTEGCGDSVYICFRKGSYVPEFLTRTPGETPVSVPAPELLLGVLNAADPAIDPATSAALAAQGSVTLLRAPFDGHSLRMLSQNGRAVYVVKPASPEELSQLLAKQTV